MVVQSVVLLPSDAL